MILGRIWIEFFVSLECSSFSKFNSIQLFLWFRAWKWFEATLLAEGAEMPQIYEEHVLLLFDIQWIVHYCFASLFDCNGHHGQFWFIKIDFAIYFCGSIQYEHHLGMVSSVVHSIQRQFCICDDDDLNNIIFHLLLLLHRDHLWSFFLCDSVDSRFW